MQLTLCRAVARPVMQGRASTTPQRPQQRPLGSVERPGVPLRLQAPHTRGIQHPRPVASDTGGRPWTPNQFQRRSEHGAAGAPWNGASHSGS